MFCPTCGQDNPAQVHFCGACGSVLEQPAAAAVPPSVAPPPSVAEYAGFWIQLSAWFVGARILFLGLILTLVVAALGRAFGGLGLDLFAAFFGLGFLALLWLYYVILTGTRGQTVGKMALGIKVIRQDGRVPGLGYAALREIVGKIVSAVALFLGFLWAAWDPQKQGWHDKIAGTRVIRARR